MGTRSQRHKTETQGFSSQEYSASNTPTNMSLSASTIVHDAAIGTVVGLMSVVDADLVDSYTFAFTSNPGTLFKFVGNSLQANVANLTAGSKAITVRVTDFYRNIFDKAFTITVT